MEERINGPVSHSLNILNMAKKILAGDRQEAYGNPEDNYANVAGYWRIYLKQIFDVDIMLEPRHAAMMMVLLKVGRTGGEHDKEDNYIDLSAYGAIAGQLSNLDR